MKKMFRPYSYKNIEKSITHWIKTQGVTGVNHRKISNMRGNVYRDFLSTLDRNQLISFRIVYVELKENLEKYMDKHSVEMPTEYVEQMNSLLKFYKLRIRGVEATLSQLKHKRKFSKYFVEEAKLLLDEETFLAIRELANLRIG